MNKGEAALELQLKAYKLPYRREYRFCSRRWRFDFVVGEDLAVEVEGGVYTKSRHTTGKGFTADCEKYNTAVLMGYRVLRFTTQQVDSGYAIDTIRKAVYGE